MTTLHEVAAVAGVTEACRYNDHSMCNNPACVCTCHKREAVEKVLIAEAVAESGPENACPKCGVKRPASESYCRVDGTRLTSLACGMCGRGMNPEDAFCFNCGAPKGTVTKVEPKPTLVVPDLSNIEQSVLRGIQEELGVQISETDNRQAQVVTEQPAGSQGTFKPVSKPNPNKVRGPKPAIQPRIRLPIKPT